MEYGIGLALLGIVAILLIGTCVLIYICGTWLIKSIETLQEAISITHALRDATQKDFGQMQIWIGEVNQGIQESIERMNALKEFCANQFISINNRLEISEKKISEFTTTSKMLH